MYFFEATINKKNGMNDIHSIYIVELLYLLHLVIIKKLIEYTKMDAITRDGRTTLAKCVLQIIRET